MEHFKTRAIRWAKYNTVRRVEVVRTGGTTVWTYNSKLCGFDGRPQEYTTNGKPLVPIIKRWEKSVDLRDFVAEGETRSAPGTSCHFCGASMIWGGDHSFEDFGYEGDGIVANLSCSNEDCGATAEFATKMEEEK